MAYTFSREQVRKQFEERGETIKDWALNHGHDYHAVIRVLSGSSKAKRGKAHQIAVDLGLKPKPESNEKAA